MPSFKSYGKTSEIDIYEDHSLIEIQAQGLEQNKPFDMVCKLKDARTLGLFLQVSVIAIQFEGRLHTAFPW
jgi:hypothetical protein